MTTKIILSLCDWSGNWSRPWAEAGYAVYCVDPKHKTKPSGTLHSNQIAIGATVAQLAHMFPDGFTVDGILAAPVCTHFTVSGAQYWPAKDADGRTAEGLALIDDVLLCVDRYRPRFWVIENPVGRLPKLRPETLGKPKIYFQPCDYAGHADDPTTEAYTKKTGLWGVFNTEMERRPVEPEFITASNGDRYAKNIMKTGGKSEKTKELRSMTPTGFSRAFYKANKNL